MFDENKTHSILYFFPQKSQYFFKKMFNFMMNLSQKQHNGLKKSNREKSTLKKIKSESTIPFALDHVFHCQRLQTAKNPSRSSTVIKVDFIPQIASQHLRDLQKAILLLILYSNNIRRIRQRHYPIAKHVPLGKLMRSSCIIYVDEIFIIKRNCTHLIVT